MSDEHDLAGNEIIDAGRSKFYLMPNCICSMRGMTASAFLLYNVYRMVCGENGTCWASDETIASFSEALSVSTIVRARKTLLTLGLIKVKRIKKNTGGHRLRIALIDVWQHNANQQNPLKSKEPTRPVAPCQIAMVDRTRQIDMVHHVNLTESTMSNCHINNTHRKKTPKKKTLSPGGDDVRGFPLPGGFIGEDRPQKRDYPAQAAKKLYGRLAAKRKIMRPPSLAKWAAEFRRFLATGQVQRPRFHAVLKWYLMNIGEPFVPQAFSAETFVQKFVRIEEAMGRMSRPIDERSMTVDQQIELVHKQVRSEPVEVFQRASWKDRLARISGEDNG